MPVETVDAPVARSDVIACPTHGCRDWAACEDCRDTGCVPPILLEIDAAVAAVETPVRRPARLSRAALARLASAEATNHATKGFADALIAFVNRQGEGYRYVLGLRRYLRRGYVRDQGSEQLQEYMDQSTDPDRLQRLLATRTGYTIIECTECAEWNWSFRTSRIDGDRYCKTCVDEHFTECAFTSHWFRDGHSSYVEDMGQVCDLHLGELPYCDECEEYSRYEHTACRRKRELCYCAPARPDFRFPADNGGSSVRSDRRLSMTLAGGVISPVGIKEIALAVYYAAPELIRRAQYELVLKMEPQWQTRDGNFTKRLAKAIYVAKLGKLEPKTISAIGNLAAAHASKDVTYHMEFTRALLESGTAEDFFHDGSCWWTDYHWSRCILKGVGGLAMRTFDDEEGNNDLVGRAWILPLDINLRPTHDTILAHAYMVFNAYGNLEGYSAARLVGHLTGKVYKQLELFKLRGRDNMAYINAMPILVADQETCAATRHILIEDWRHS